MRTFDEYQKDARRTQGELGRQERLFHAIFGLCSEAGEAAGILQKTWQGHELDRGHLSRELGDCLWMIAEACDALGMSMGDVARDNIRKLYLRYPDGFAPERSLHRGQEDI